MIAATLALLAVQASTRAESLLASGDVQGALKLAQQVVYQRPRDARAHLLLGRVHYARPVTGRFAALDEFKTANRLDPTDPAPLYWQMKVGLYLRGDDGDHLAREALLQLFALTPDYLDAWNRFHDVYRNPEIWHRAERALARHGDHPAALAHRAELWIALGDGARADSLLAVLMARAPLTVATCLLRSEASFLAGRDSAGYAWHDAALARADADSTDALWSEAWTIAGPEEGARHAATAPGKRHAFFERFWGERDPNLLTVPNERVREHFARRAEARRMYRLLHPQRMAYHSRPARALHQAAIRDELRLLGAAGGVPGPSSGELAVAQRVARLVWEQSGLQDTALSLAARAGLSAQGLVFLRYGRPDRQSSCITDVVPMVCGSPFDRETWLYWTPGGPLGVTFTGSEYFLPVSTEQLRSARTLLKTDRTTLPAPLAARGWTAWFQSADLGLTDAYYRHNGDSAAVALWDTGGQMPPARARGADLLKLTAPPGRYRVGLDVDSAGRHGRWRGDVTIPYFSPVELGLSSLVLAQSSVPRDRDDALRRMPADLVYPPATPLAAYAEVYGLGIGPTGARAIACSTSSSRFARRSPGCSARPARR